MNRFKVIVAMCSASFLFGCGLPATGTCSVTLTGAATGTFPCSVIIASDGEKAGFTVTGSGAYTFVGGVTLPAQLLPQDYSSPEGFTQFVTTGGTGVWNQSLHHTDLANHPDKGSFLLHFSSVGDATHAHAKGPITAEMPADPATGVSGTVIANVTFSDSVGESGGSGGGSGSGGGAGGGSGGGSGGGGGASDSCTVTWSGPVSGTQSCVISGSMNNLHFTTADQSLSGLFQYTGPDTTGTFTTAAPVTGSLLEVFQNGSQWAQSYSSTNPSGANGTFSVTITNAGTFDPSTSVRSGTHGTWTATATPASPVTGSNVTVNVTF